MAGKLAPVAQQFGREKGSLLETRSLAMGIATILHGIKPLSEIPCAVAKDEFQEAPPFSQTLRATRFAREHSVAGGHAARHFPLAGARAQRPDGDL